MRYTCIVQVLANYIKLLVNIYSELDWGLESSNLDEVIILEI